MCLSTAPLPLLLLRAPTLDTRGGRRAPASGRLFAPRARPSGMLRAGVALLALVEERAEERALGVDGGGELGDLRGEVAVGRVRGRVGVGGGVARGGGRWGDGAGSAGAAVRQGGGEGGGEEAWALWGLWEDLQGRMGERMSGEMQVRAGRTSSCVISFQTMLNSRPRTKLGRAMRRRPKTRRGMVMRRPRKERGVISP